MLATTAAATYDFEKLLWIPKPMIVVPEMPQTFNYIWMEEFGRIIKIYDVYHGEILSLNSIEEIDNYIETKMIYEQLH